MLSTGAGVSHGFFHSVLTHASETLGNQYDYCAHLTNGETEA